MTTRITAEAIIKGSDQTGAAFASLQAKIDALVKKFGQVGKAAAISGQIDKLNASLKKTRDQLAGVQKLQTAEEKLARLATRNAQQQAITEEQANGAQRGLGTAGGGLVLPPARRGERAAAQPRRRGCCGQPAGLGKSPAAWRVKITRRISRCHSQPPRDPHGATI